MTPPCATAIDPSVEVRGDDRWKPRQPVRRTSSCGSPPGITSHRSCSQICRNTGSPAAARDAELAALPVAEEHLAQIRHLDRVEAESLGERRRGLVRALQRRHVDRVDALVLRAGRRGARPVVADRVERRVAVPVAHRERLAGHAPAPTRRGARAAPSSRPAARRSGAGGTLRAEWWSPVDIRPSIGRPWRRHSSRRPNAGRVVTIARHVGLARRAARHDGAARRRSRAILQDVADRDAASAAVDGAGVWVLRRLVMRIDRTPRFRADLDAARRGAAASVPGGPNAAPTSMFGERPGASPAAGLWVHVDTATRRARAAARGLRRPVGRLGERPARPRRPAAQVVADGRRRLVVAAARHRPRRARPREQRRVLGAGRRGARAPGIARVSPAPRWSSATASTSATTSPSASSTPPTASRAGSASATTCVPPRS